MQCVSSILHQAPGPPRTPTHLPHWLPLVGHSEGQPQGLLELCASALRDLKLAEKNNSRNYIPQSKIVHSDVHVSVCLPSSKKHPGELVSRDCDLTGYWVHHL